MTALASLELAVEQATQQRDQARQRLTQVQAQLQAARAQSDQLEGYAQETQARWVTQSKSQSTPELMRHYYQFMDKLYQAIALQGQALQEAAQRVAAQQEALLQAEFRLASRQTVRDNMQLAARMRRDKIEQKQVDEMAAQQHRRNLTDQYRGGER